MTSLHAKRCWILFAFQLTAAIGPLLQWLIAGSRSSRGRGAEVVPSSFLSDLVFLIWPTQPLAVVEGGLGRAHAAVWALGGNFALFAIIGAVAAGVFPLRWPLMGLYLGLALMVFLYGFWGAGFNVKYLSPMALVVAWGVYALPFIFAGFIAPTK